VLSVLIGMAIDRGDLQLDQKLSDILPEASAANVNPRVREISVRDLLTMTAGFGQAGNRPSLVSAPESETRQWWLLERPMKYPAGTRFDNDAAGQNLLSIVLMRAIKQDARAFAERNLFAPTRIADRAWTSEADGHLLRAAGLFLTGRDMEIGLLYLQRGRWSDKQIVSHAFVADSTAKHNEGGPPGHAGYGYFWWAKKTNAGLDAFFAAGHNSQLIYVVPKLGVVVGVGIEKIPGGSVAFVNDLVLPAEAELPPTAPCVTRLEYRRAEVSPPRRKEPAYFPSPPIRFQ